MNVTLLRVTGLIEKMLENITYESLDYDPNADALYLTFSKAKITRTFEVLADWPLVLLDFDAQGMPVGIEIVGVKQFGLDFIIKKLQEKMRLKGEGSGNARDLRRYLVEHQSELALS